MEKEEKKNGQRRVRPPPLPIVQMENENERTIVGGTNRVISDAKTSPRQLSREWVRFGCSDGWRNSDGGVWRRAGHAEIWRAPDVLWLVRKDEAEWLRKTTEASWFPRIKGPGEASTRNDRRGMAKPGGSCRCLGSVESSRSSRRGETGCARMKWDGPFWASKRGDRSGLSTLFKWSSAVSRMRYRYFRAVWRWSGPKC